MPIRDPRNAFVPGQWQGPVALGGVGRRKDEKAATTNVGVNKYAGNKATRVFPWLACVKTTLAGTSTSQVVRLTRTNGGSIGEPTFYNDTGQTVRIEEIRFVAMAPTHSPAGELVVNVQFDMVRRFGVNIRHSDYEIVRDFLPIYALATENNKAHMGMDASRAMVLPTPYRNPAGNPFQLRVRSTNYYGSASTAYPYGVSLFGSDPQNHPYVLAREDSFPYDTTASEASPQVRILSFNENTGGGPVKDQNLTRINFNLAQRSALPNYDYLYGMNLEVQFIPPEGPKWHSPTDWFPVNGIVHQGQSQIMSSGTTAGIIVQQNWLSHRPVTPHVLSPQQQLWFDFKCYQDAFYVSNNGARNVNVYQVPLWVVLIGTQEVPV